MMMRWWREPLARRFLATEPVAPRLERSMVKVKLYSLFYMSQS